MTSPAPAAPLNSPLLDRRAAGPVVGLPRFDAITADQVQPAMLQVLAQVAAQLADLEGEAPALDAGSLLARLEHLFDDFGATWGVVDHLLSVRSTDALREAHEAIQPEVVALGLRLSQSQPLYAALERCLRDPAFASLPRSEQRALELQARDARLSGVGLQGDKQARFATVVQELAELATQFQNHVLDATKAWQRDLTDPAEVAGLPPSLLALMAQRYASAQTPAVQPDSERGPWRLTLDFPCFGPFLQHSTRRELRELAYRAYVQRASEGPHDNRMILHNILRLRQEQAQLLGFANYAALSLASKMAPSVDAVLARLEMLRQQSWPAGVQDMRDLKELAASKGAPEAADLKPWDVAYWSEQLRRARFDLDEEALRPYFPLPKVLEGVFVLAQRLFGVRIAAADGQAPVWHPDVRFFAVQDSQGQPQAYFYLDPYSRPAEKRGGAWMNECLGRSAVLGLNGQPRLPVAYLICNQTPPVGNQPSLMTFAEVETLLHEFGHGLQHMLTQVDNGLVSGIRGVEWDAVELPSQFMENWALHPGTMAQLSGHFETGAPLPADLFAKLLAARTYRSGSDMLRQLTFAMTDLALHTASDASALDAFAVHRQIAEKTAPLPPLPEDRFLCSFGHIFAGGYAAGYYSYKWAEILSADAFAAFEEAGLDEPATVAAVGKRFADTVLGLGGAEEPMAVFTAFRGREPAVEALLRHAGLA